VTDRSRNCLTALFKRRLRPQLLKTGWRLKDVYPPRLKEVTKERVRTSRASEDRPLLLVPIFPLNPRDAEKGPIGVIRVTDKAAEGFTDEDQRVLESLARVIALHDSHDKYRSGFIEKAVYNLRPEVMAIASCADRLQNPEHVENTGDEYRKLKSLCQYLHDVFLGLAYNYIDERFRPGPEPAELNGLVRDVVHLFSDHADYMYHKPAPRAEHVFRPAARRLDVTTRASLLSVAVLHLLDNAFKACAHADNLRVGVLRSRRDATIYVEDDGPGIPKEHLPRIGELFYQFPYETEDVRRGLGIGLSAVTHIVQNDLMGRVLLESRRSRQQGSLIRNFATGRIEPARHPKLSHPTGTRVTVVLPLDKAT